MSRRTKTSIELENRHLKNQIAHLQARIGKDDAEELLATVVSTLQSATGETHVDVEKLLDAVSERMEVYTQIAEYTKELGEPNSKVGDVAESLIDMHRDLGEALGAADPVDHIHTAMLRTHRISPSASEADALEALYEMLEQ